MVNLHSKKLVSGPEIQARGFLEGDQDKMFDGIRAEIAKALTDALEEGVSDTYRLQQVIRRRIGRWVSGKLRRRPMIVPVVVST